MVRQRKIVVVEDEENILQVISYNLAQEGFEVLKARDGESGLEMIRRSRPDLAILDLMLPGLDGLEICRQIRANPSFRDMLVIMVTARDQETDVVLGLGVGADDYLTKPFSTKELVARVKAALRRGPLREGGSVATRIECGGLTIDPYRHFVAMDGKTLELTPAEFQLLYCLAEQPGRVFRREDLLSRIGGDDVFVIVRNIDTHIKTLRKKLGPRADLIETVRGIGYRFPDLEDE